MGKRAELTVREEYKGIDFMRYLFAVLIPLLHVPFQSGTVIHFLQQYVSRLGVPFFFAVSGFMLARSVMHRGAKVAVVRYVKRIAFLLIVWLVIYSPLIYVGMRGKGVLQAVQSLLFLTPAYLWYLTALVVAAIPFCLIKNERLLYILGAALYLLGTVFGGSYTWLFGRIEIYEDIFLTTRNGIFFGFPMMCVGRWLVTCDLSLSGWKRWVLPMIAIGLFWLEVFFVQKNMIPGADSSMYLMLPVVVAVLLAALKDAKLPFATKWMRGASSAVYLMQFGVITVGMKLLEIVQIPVQIQPWIAYFAAIAVPTACYILLRRTKVAKLFS